MNSLSTCFNVQCTYSIKSYVLIFLTALVLCFLITQPKRIEMKLPNPIQYGRQSEINNRLQNATLHKNKQTSYHRRKTTAKSAAYPTSKTSEIPTMTSHVICPLFVCGTCGLGNKIFQFASAYGIALRMNGTLVLTKQDIITQVFEISDKTNIKILNNTNVCNKAKEVKERHGCGTFDPRFMDLNSNTNYKVGDFLFSWKYFKGFEKQVRSQLAFKSYLEKVSKRFIEGIVHKYGYRSGSDVVLIGIHVRRGDMTLDFKRKRGYNVATREYFQKAILIFSNMIEKPIVFIIATNDHPWVRNNILLNENLQNFNFETVKNFTAEIDFAILSHCDHVITSVGTFGWWAAWIANGITTYYKWPAQPNTYIGNQYNANFTDFFYSSWIGIS